LSKTSLNRIVNLHKNQGKGHRILGDGSFAIVYSYGKDKAVRIQDSWGGEDQCNYHNYIMKSLKSKSKHAPKIYFHGEIGEDLITVMEKLKEIENHGASLTDFVCQGVLYDKKFVKYKRSLKNFTKWCYDRGVDFNDIHFANILFRKDQNGKYLVPVITDPVYG